MKKILVSLLISVLTTFFSCEKINYYPDDPVIYDHTIVLSHHGVKTSEHRENTFEACVNALNDYEGLEVDIQMSKDHTIWLSHLSDAQFCDGSSSCFIETSDEEIESITTCSGVDIGYTKLEDVLK